MAMTASLVGGAVARVVFGELLKAVVESIDKATMFKQTLAYLRSTLVAIAPLIKEIEQQNADLGRPKQELESLIREMEEGRELVCKCTKIHSLNFVARARSKQQLEALVNSLTRFFMIDMQAQTARDQKETLLKVRKIHSTVNKLLLVNAEDPEIGDVNESDRDSWTSATQSPENATGTSSSEQELKNAPESPNLLHTGSSKEASRASTSSKDEPSLTNASHNVHSAPPLKKRLLPGDFYSRNYL